MKRVLLAEDDLDTATVIKETLEERLPIAVEHVTNGALVLDQIAIGGPDLLILDVSMPGLNGIDVFDLVRGSAGRAHMPVLFLTAAPERAKRAFGPHGVRDVMAKPFDADALVERVDELLARAVTTA